MAQVENRELVDRFEQFFRNYYREAIAELAQRYPNEQRSLHVDWTDLYTFEPDLADDYVAQPDQLREYAEEALRLYDLPVDVSLGQAHVRIQGLPEITEIRAIRSRDVNTLVSIRGIVRKATDVRPKIEEAAFECQRCGTITYIPQSGGFQEPHECQGCERQGPFVVNHDQSTFVDAQKLRVQESPEGLRGGETPQSLDVHIEDDVTGLVSPGDHVTVTGVLRIEQQKRGTEKSRVFDVHMEGHSLVIEDAEFESMDITEADKQAIIELSQEDDLYEQMVDSIAPSIYGFEEEKLAMALQLFSGVTKHLPDESRIRGDLHILLIGDPGTGKCSRGDAKVTLADGCEEKIGDLVERHLDGPTEIDDGFCQEVDISVLSVAADGDVETRRASRVWKRESPDRMCRIQTASGLKVEVTPSHPLFVQADGRIEPKIADNLRRGEFIAVPRQINSRHDDCLDVDYRRSRSRNNIRLDLPDAWTPWLARLTGYIIAEGHVSQREDKCGCVWLSNNDRELLDDYEKGLEKLGLNYNEEQRYPGKPLRRVWCGSSEFVSFLANLEPAVLERSSTQRVPNPIMGAGSEIKAQFLQAYIEAEGHVSTKEREIIVASMSRELLEQVRTLLLAHGIRSQLQERPATESYRLRISGTDFVKYVGSIGFVTERKQTAASAVDELPENPNTDVIPDIGNELRRIRETLELSQFDCGLPRSTYQQYERGDRNPSRASFRTVLELFEDRLGWLHETRQRIQEGEWTDVEAVREELNISQQALADRIGVTQRAISYYEREQAVPDGGRTTLAKDVVLDRIDQALTVEDDVASLRTLMDGDIGWDRIDSIEKIEPDYDWVYDLEVEGTHNYIANNIVSHNSQVLQYIRNIAPRSVYTSGKGSSAAGLTASAVQDDFGEGQQWTLEAGALVLADKGIAAVDELDKMRCVTGDALVHMGDGDTFPIEEIAQRYVANGEIEEVANGRTIRGIDAEVYTMTDDGRIVTRPVEAVHEYEAPDELYEVTLETGERLTTTNDHPFFLSMDGERIERPAHELEAGDAVYVPNSRSMVTDGGVARVPTSMEDEASGAGRTGDSRYLDVQTRRISSIRRVSGAGRVYDLTVEGTHNFIANGMIVHNSEDRSAMHEALEQQSISVSKAGINATLKSRCSLLGAANPRYGRFDQYEPIAEQIELDPALISRFDLIFTVTDQPDEEQDRKLADHILRSNYAGELSTQRTELASPNVTEDEVQKYARTVEPAIDPELFRKYVAYAKRNVFPSMTDEAQEAIRDFYVELRSRGMEEDAPVPITARKLEALVRLAEASARIRLSDTVEHEDAERVIRIVRSSLRDIGVDPETGQFDADIIETEMSKSQRDRVRTIKSLVEELEDDYEDGAPVEELMERAAEIGIEESKVEHEIEKLRQKGEIYEPSTNHLRTT